jgi:hypothetical protein
LNPREGMNHIAKRKNELIRYWKKYNKDHLINKRMHEKIIEANNEKSILYNQKKNDNISLSDKKKNSENKRNARKLRKIENIVEFMNYFVR